MADFKGSRDDLSFLNVKNSFIFESVEKGFIKGRYTIFGKNPDKIWEFKNKISYLIQNEKKIKLKDKPENLIEKIIEEFKFETPKNLPKLCSLISGYFSYDSIRYIEKIPNNCKDDLNIPDVRLLRPRTLIIHDNLKKEIFYIRNIYKDEKIRDYKKKFDEVKSDLFKLLIQSSIKNIDNRTPLKSKNIKNVNISYLKKLIFPPRPIFFIANEFFDALPIKQYLKAKNKWFESTLVTDPADGRIKFSKIELRNICVPCETFNKIPINISTAYIVSSCH